MATSLLDDCIAYATPMDVINLILLTLFTVVIKRRYFSPLSDIPGPFLACITRFWRIKTLLQGDSVHVI